MKHNTLYKSLKILSASLVFVSIVPQSIWAEENAVATEMRLVEMDGKVHISSSSGKAIFPLENMRISSGNIIETEAKSYAQLSLDDTKLLKVDSTSEAEVRKNGKKLEVLLNRGSMFFNITKDLNEDESLNIRTSTMVTGIRGTSGYVERTLDGKLRIVLLEGHVTIQYMDMQGEIKTITIDSGQSLELIEDPISGNKVVEVIITELQESDVPGFVAVELRDDIQLQEKVRNEGAIDVDVIIKSADQSLEQDEKEKDSYLFQLDDDERKVIIQNSIIQPVDEVSDDDSNSSSGGSEPKPEPEPTITIVGTDITLDELQTLLYEGDVKLSPNTRTRNSSIYTIDGLLEIPEGIMLDTSEIELVIDGIGDLDGLMNDGNLLSGDITILGGVLDNTELGNISASNMNIHQLGSYENYGVAILNEVAVYDYGRMEMWDGTVSLTGNQGVYINEGNFYQYGGRIESEGDGITIEVQRSTNPEMRVDEILLDGGSFQADAHILQVDLTGNPDDGFEIGPDFIQITSNADLTSKLGLNIPAKEPIPISYDGVEIDYATDESIALSSGYERLTGITLQTNEFELPASRVVDSDKLKEELELYNVEIKGDAKIGYNDYGDPYTSDKTLTIDGDLYIVAGDSASYYTVNIYGTIIADNIYVNGEENLGSIEVRIHPDTVIQVGSILIGSNSQWRVSDMVTIRSSKTMFVINGSSSYIGIGPGILQSEMSILGRASGNSNRVAMDIYTEAAVGYKDNFFESNYIPSDLIEYYGDRPYGHKELDSVDAFVGKEVEFDNKTWNQLIAVEGILDGAQKTIDIIGDPFIVEGSSTRKGTVWNSQYQTEDIPLEEKLQNDIP